MQSAPNPPAAPDPATTAGQQTLSNIQTAIANAQLNRVNQQTPWGSISYTQGPPGPNGVPTWSSQIQLSPAQQQLLEQQQGLSSERNQYAQAVMNEPGFAAPLDFSRLHSITNRGETYHGAVNAGPVQSLHLQPPPTVQPQSQQQPQQQSGDDPMLAALLAALTQQQGQQGGTAPTTAASGPANINAGVKGNPLDALLAGRNPYGSLGGLIGGSGYTTEGGDTVYGDGFVGASTPAGQAATQALQNYNGKGQYTQLRDDNIGGPGEAIDSSKVIYDPQYGMITPTSNVKELGQGTLWDRYGGYLLMAPVLAGAALGAGTAGEAAGTAGATGTAGTAGAVGEGLGAVAPGMEAQAAMESQLLNAGITPGTEAWASAMANAGLDETAGAGLSPHAPVSSGSTPIPGTNPQSWWQQALDNLSHGRGLLGTSTPTQTAIRSLLPSILRMLASQQQQQPQQGGGSK